MEKGAEMASEGTEDHVGEGFSHFIRKWEEFNEELNEIIKFLFLIFYDPKRFFREVKEDFREVFRKN